MVEDTTTSSTASAEETAPETTAATASVTKKSVEFADDKIEEIPIASIAAVVPSTDEEDPREETDYQVAMKPHRHRCASDGACSDLSSSRSAKPLTLEDHNQRMADRQRRNCLIASGVSLILAMAICLIFLIPTFTVAYQVVLVPSWNEQAFDGSEHYLRKP